MYKSNQNAKKALEGVVGEHSPVENLLRPPSKKNRAKGITIACIKIFIRSYRSSKDYPMLDRNQDVRFGRKAKQS